MGNLGIQRDNHIVIEKKKSVYKWIREVQTHFVQESTVDYCNFEKIFKKIFKNSSEIQNFI